MIVRLSSRAGALLLAATLLGLVSVPVIAQEAGRIQGTVIDGQSQRPLVGAQVSIQGTGLGTVTGVDGEYQLLNVPAGTYTVRVQFIGYGTGQQETMVSTGAAATADFELEQTAVAMDEIVVTGTAAEVRRKEVGNSVDGVSAREIQSVQARGTDELLAGRAPGVTVMTNSGQPGAGGTIKVRGMSTASQSIEPLIYVDGIRIHNTPVRTGWDSRTGYNPLQDIPAEDIERIEVVKGASATTLYGTEASGGVIQIFTKKGISGAPIWTAEVGLGLNHQSSFLANTDGHPTDLYTKCGDLENLYSLNIQDDLSSETFGDREYLYDPTCPSDGSWQQLGPTQDYSLSVRGGAGDVTYYISGNYSDQQGVLQTGRNREGGFRGNFGFAPLDNLSVALNSSYTHRTTGWVNDGNNADGFLLNVGRGSKNYFKGGKDEVAEVCAAAADTMTAPDGSSGVTCITNGYLFDANLESGIDHFITGLTVNWSPLEGLSNRLNIGWDYSETVGESWVPFGDLRQPDGLFWDENTRRTKLSFDYAGSFQNTFGEDFASTFSWGGQIFRDHTRWTEVDVEKFAGPGRPTLETGAELTDRNEYSIHQTNAGFFFQEMLGWKDRLFLTGGLRVDGNSAFGDNFGLQTYPKVSVSYVLSDYGFWPTDWFETFKLRGALGYSGRAPGPFDKARTWSPIGLEGEPGFTPDNVGNPDLGPETTREIEVGFDASLLSGRLGAEATYFHAKTTDALVGELQAASNGFLNTRLDNVGTLENSGYEFQITAVPVRTRNIDWRVYTNLSFIESEAIDLAGEQISAGLLAEIWEGHPIPVYIGDRIMNPNEVADPVIVEDTVLGPAFPTRMIGVGTTLQLGDRFTVDALAEHQGGHYLPNYTGYQNARRGSWHPCFAIQEKMIAKHNGDASALDGVRAIDRARCGINEDIGYDHSSHYWVEKADFWKLRSVMLTFNVPDEWVRFGSNASVSLAARNLLTWTDYSGTDPEVEDFADRANSVYGDGGDSGDYGRRDYYQIPNPRTYTLRFRISW